MRLGLGIGAGGLEKHEDVVSWIRSFVRSAERTTAGSEARGRRNGMCLRYRVGVAVCWTASRNVHDGWFPAGNALAGLTSALGLEGLRTAPNPDGMSAVPLRYGYHEGRPWRTSRAYLSCRYSSLMMLQPTNPTRHSNPIRSACNW